MKNLIKAVNAVMKECPTIEKNSQVGKGSFGYKGVKDSELKLMLNRAMRTNGLAIFPQQIDESTEIHRWKADGKEKMQVFTKVNSKFLLIHESGEQIEINGVGHSVDSQDKGAGKATTYALKYALLYTFMIATGEIDDADDYHNDDIDEPDAEDEKELVDVGTQKFDSAVIKIMSDELTVAKIKTKFRLTQEAEKKLKAIENAD